MRILAYAQPVPPREASRAMRPLVVLWWATIFACAPAEVLSTPELPEAVTHAALLGLGEDGQVVARSNFAPREGSSFELRVSESGAPVRYRVFGWTEVDLGEFALPPDVRADFSPVALADAKDPLLPSPSFVAAGERSRLTLEPDDEPIPELTAEWLPPCPSLFPSGRALLGDFQCVRQRCDFSFSQQGCSFEIDTGDCRVMLAGSIDGRGRLQVDELGTEIERCVDAGMPRDPALHTLDCRLHGYDCHLELYEPGAPPRIRAQLVDLTRSDLAGELNVGVLPPRGAVGGLAVLADRLVVARLGEWVPGGECRSARPSELLFFDKDTLEPTGTATAPPCMERLQASPNRDRFVAVFRDADHFHLGEFTSNGQLLRRVLLAPVSALPETMTTKNAVRSILWAGDRIYVSTTLGDVVLAYDALTFELSWQTAPMGSRPKSDLLSTPDGIVMSDLPDLLYFITPETGAFIRPANLTAICRASVFDPTNLMYDARLGRYLVIDRALSSEVYVLSADLGSCESASYFEASAEAYAAVPLPADPAIAMFGLWNEATSEVSLALMDLDAPRFLPGSIHFAGAGPPWDMFAEGRVVYGLIAGPGGLFRAEWLRD